LSIALLTNIALSPKGLSGTNTLAYFSFLQVTEEKSLMILAPGRALCLETNADKSFFLFVTDEEAK